MKEHILGLGQNVETVNSFVDETAGSAAPWSETLWYGGPGGTC